MNKVVSIIVLATVVLMSNVMAGFWDPIPPSSPTSASGLSMQHVSLSPVKEGMSLEQYNIAQRYIHDNKPDAMKYVYVIGENGQVCLHYTILGKVTSSGKRLTPRTVAAYGGEYQNPGMDITIGSRTYETEEVIEDDGTYGSSSEYVYMWTTTGNYIQVIPMGSFLMVVADKQLTTTELTFTMEVKAS